MILTVCLNPTLQKTLCFSAIQKGAVNRACSQRWDASGKGINVSRVLTQLGYETLHLTQAGGDLKDFFCRKAQEDNISLITVPCESQIRCCTTILEHHEDGSYRTTELVEEGEVVQPETEHQVWQLFQQCVLRCDCEAVIISGSKAKGFSDELYPQMVSYTLSRNIPVIADYRGDDLTETLKAVQNISFDVPFIIKPNREEFCATFLPKYKSIIQSDVLYKTIKDISSIYKCIILVTQEEKFVISCINDSLNFTDTVFISPHKIINTIGCGDSFTAGFCSVLVNKRRGGVLSGNWLSEAINEGNRCGALNAQSVRPGSLY